MELEIIKWLGYVLTGILGWFVRILWTAQDQMRRDFTELEKNMPLVYVRKDDFREDIAELKQGFREAVAPILIKLDRLEDKHDQAVTEIHARIERVTRVGTQ